MPPTPTESSLHHFPGEDSLCESCGYSLKGLPSQGDCPECGTSIESSAPKHRTGLPFEQRPTVGNYVKTACLILRHPKRSARKMDIASRIARPRLFLAINSILAAAIWLVLFTIPLPNTFAGNLGLARDAWVILLVLIPCAIIPSIWGLTYIEALGVTAFSRRKGWRIPFRLAQRVACFASIGWVPGAAFLGAVMNFARSNLIQDFWSAVGGPWTNSSGMAGSATLIAGILAMLGFELLVWVSIRQVRYANPSV